MGNEQFTFLMLKSTPPLETACTYLTHTVTRYLLATNYEFQKCKEIIIVILPIIACSKLLLELSFNIALQTFKRTN